MARGKLNELYRGSGDWHEDIARFVNENGAKYPPKVRFWIFLLNWNYLTISIFPSNSCQDFHIFNERNDWNVQVVKKTKELITKQATVIAKRADEHEDFITKVNSCVCSSF
jgi:hypothetical protein